MTNYKINIKYGNDNLNDIFIKVLKKELNNYLKTICNNKTEYFTYLSLKKGGEKKY